MMNFIKIICYSLGIILLFTFAKANNKESYYGHIDLSNVTLEIAEINGSGNIKDSSFNSLSIFGFLEAQNIMTNDLFGSGYIRATNITVNSQTMIQGRLEAKNSKLGYMGIGVNPDIISLENSMAKNIVFEDSSKDQELILKGSTVIEGDITFKSKKGKVIADNTVVIQGKIIGGELIQKESIHPNI